MNDIHNREKQITRTSIVGIAANLLLAAFKAGIGLITGSIAIVLDAVNNTTDAMSSVITIAGIKLAKRKPDEKHPFGYGRIEYFSAIIIAGLVLFAGITSLIESVKKIIHPEVADYTVVAIIIVAAAVVVKVLLGRYVKAQGIKYNSDALVASGADASFDAIISASTLVGAAVTMIFHISIDGFIGALISFFIIKAGLEMLLDSISSVVGSRPDSEITLDIKQAIREIDGVAGAYDLILHNYGPDNAIGSVHVEIPADMTASEVHTLTKRIQLAIMDKFHVFLTVGIYALDMAYEKERREIGLLAMRHEGVLGTHGVFINPEEKYASFDVLTDFTVADRNKLVSDISCEVESGILPGYTIDISLDTNFSD